MWSNSSDPLCCILWRFYIRRIISRLRHIPTAYSITLIFYHCKPKCNRMAFAKLFFFNRYKMIPKNINCSAQKDIKTCPYRILKDFKSFHRSFMLIVMLLMECFQILSTSDLRVQQNIYHKCTSEWNTMVTIDKRGG